MKPSSTNDTDLFLNHAVALARESIQTGGRPFGAVVVKSGEVIGTAVNEFHLSDDVTDHAELLALRAAARAHGSQSLKGAAVYASGQPCPMCMAAIRLVGVTTVAYAYSREDWVPFDVSKAAASTGARSPMNDELIDISHVRLESESDQNLYEQWRQIQK